MCGFLGLFGPSTKKLVSSLESASEGIKHRGPDASGFYVSGDGLCALAHRRLSIIDLSEASNQPLRRGHVLLVYNGELYNHDALRKNLHVEDGFLTHGDTETVLRGYENRGFDFFSDCIGMFAGAVYDESKRELSLFRDQLGIKPLYYLQLGDGTVVFSSEIKGILKTVPQFKRTCSKSALLSYMVYENFPQGLSLFNDIKLLEPGRGLLISSRVHDNVVLDERSFSFGEKGASDTIFDSSHLGEVLLEKLVESVESHLLSDVPLGVYLSGGTDSSLVAAFASKRKSDLLGFTGYFETEDCFYDERPVSKSVANFLKIDLMEVKITPQDFEKYLDGVVYALDEPRMGMGAFSQFVVAKTAAQYRKVILAGHGGDELFGGYPAFKAFWLLQTGMLSVDTWRSLASVKGKELPWLVNVIMNRIRTGKLQFAPELFSLKLFENDEESITNAFAGRSTSFPLQKLREYYFSTYLPGLLIVEDKISMAHSLETRVPLWSQSLVSWASNIPVDKLLPGGRLKGLLREVIRPYLPDEVFTAPKRGFPTPLRLWFKKKLLPFISERLLGNPSPVHDIFPRNKIQRLLRSHERVRLPFALDERRAHRIWILLCLESWMRQFNVVVGGEMCDA